MLSHLCCPCPSAPQHPSAAAITSPGKEEGSQSSTATGVVGVASAPGCADGNGASSRLPLLTTLSATAAVNVSASHSESNSDQASTQGPGTAAKQQPGTVQNSMEVLEEEQGATGAWRAVHGVRRLGPTGCHAYCERCGAHKHCEA